jgi:SOS regulatory protein LexA
MGNDDTTYLAKLQRHYVQHRTIPSYAGIGKLVGLSSKSSAHALASRLKEAGYLQDAPGGRLAPAKRFFERQIADARVAAGAPAAVAESAGDALLIDEYLVEHPGKTILVTVKGDSMQDAGILPGDVVIVERGVSANVGDIVVAIVDNEFTIKTLASDRHGFYLKAANPAYPPIRPKGQMEIFGVVVSQFRKYRKPKR